MPEFDPKTETFYMIRSKNGHNYKAGTGKRAVPKLYKLGNAKSVCRPGYEVVPVTIILGEAFDPNSFEYKLSK